MSLQPICILCLSVCDRTGSLSSCQHFFCARCVARLPPPATHPCPFCHKPFKLVKLNAPPLQSLFQDANTLLSQTCKIISSQLMHHQQIVIRMREALKVLNAKYQASEKKASELNSTLEAERKELHMLRRVAEEQKQEMTVMRKELELREINTSENYNRRNNSNNNIINNQTSSMHNYCAREGNAAHKCYADNHFSQGNSNNNNNINSASEQLYTHQSNAPRISSTTCNSTHYDQNTSTRDGNSHTSNQVAHGDAILHIPSAAHVMYSSAPPSPLHTGDRSTYITHNNNSNTNNMKYSGVEPNASDVHLNEHEMHRSREPANSTLHKREGDCVARQLLPSSQIMTHFVQPSRSTSLRSSAERLRALTPLGWSATSEIMKRHRSEEGPSQASQHRQQQKEQEQQEHYHYHQQEDESINHVNIIDSISDNKRNSIDKKSNHHNMYSSTHSVMEQRNVPSTPISQSFPLHQLHSRNSSGKSTTQNVASTNNTNFRLSTPLVNTLQPSQNLPHYNNTLLSPYGSFSTNTLHQLGMPKPLQNLLAARQNSLSSRQGNGNNNNDVVNN